MYLFATIPGPPTGAGGGQGTGGFKRGDVRVTCVNYSMDDSMLAVATTDNAITVFFKSLAAYEKQRVISVATSGSLSHMDWSLDCRFLRGATNFHDLLLPLHCQAIARLKTFVRSCLHTTCVLHI